MLTMTSGSDYVENDNPSFHRETTARLRYYRPDRRGT